MVDELADLMIIYPEETKNLIVKILQCGHLVGIHIVAATQHQKGAPGIIRANANSTACFDSEDYFLGLGNMLYSRRHFQCPEQIRCSFVSSDETERIMSFMAEKNGKAEYDENIIGKIEEYESGIRERVRNGMGE